MGWGDNKGEADRNPGLTLQTPKTALRSNYTHTWYIDINNHDANNITNLYANNTYMYSLILNCSYSPK